MNRLEAIRNNLMALRQGLIIKFLVDVISENITEVEDVLIGQLEIGRDGSGNLISPAYRSETYGRIKKFLGSKAPLGIPDLKKTGKFHRGITAKLSGTALTFSSTDSKESDLLAKYGEDIFFLNESSKEMLADALALPELLVKVKTFILS